ncbi:MAG: tetratricopeptide repeat protein [Terracidiphilus sp.]
MPRRHATLIMVRRFLSSILLLCSAAAAQTPAYHLQSQGSTLQGLYEAAQRSQNSGDLTQAAGNYRGFLAEALGELANSHAQIGDYGRAAALFDEALILNPGSPSLQRDYAATALEAGDLKHAETLARGLLNDDPDDPKGLALAHQILGRTLHRMNRDQEARKELETAVSLDPSFPNEYDLAVVCLDLDDENCATQIFSGLEAARGDSPALHMQFGLAYGNSDFTPHAVTEFKKVIAEDPHYPGAHYSVAAALLAAGEDEKTLQEAEAELKQELTISPNDFLTYAALGKIEASYRRYPEAESYLKRAIALNPKNPDAFLYLGQMYFDTNRPTEAEVNLRRAIELTTDMSRNHYQIQKAHFLLGRILMQKHQEEKAHAEMQIAHTFADKALSKDKNQLAGLLDNKPEGGGASNSAIDAAAMTPTPPHAADPSAVAKQKAFEKQLTPAIADSYNNLGAIMASEKNYAEALKLFEQAKAWSPTLEGLDYNVGRAEFMSANFSDAIPPLSHYLRSHPADSGIRGALAMSLFMTHDYMSCINDLKGAGEAVASIPQMQYIYAESLVKTGEVSLGKERLEKLEAAHPEIPEVHRAMGGVWELEGDCERALKELDTASQLNGSDPETHFDLGKTESRCGNIGDAIQELETAVRLMPDDASYHQELSDAYERVFRMADAEKEHRIAEQLKAAQAPVAKGGASPEGKSPSQ